MPHTVDSFETQSSPYCFNLFQENCQTPIVINVPSLRWGGKSRSAFSSILSCWHVKKPPPPRQVFTNPSPPPGLTPESLILDSFFGLRLVLMKNNTSELAGVGQKKILIEFRLAGEGHEKRRMTLRDGLFGIRISTFRRRWSRTA